MESQKSAKLKISGVILAASIFFPLLAPASSNVSHAVTDTVITGKVKSGLAANDVTHAQNIMVETNDGVVRLSGTTKSETEATKAIEIAESTSGVQNVDASHLYVQDSQQPLTDAYITAKVKGVFLKNNLTAGKKNVPLLDVKVETQQGVVYLSGHVKNASERTKLINLAKSVDGVTNVKSTLN